ncbi:MAG TPA: hypothetical protein VD963_00910, partial [Phycisphaerales bacterium]|nr:hypothetical protein [Phycisphaerales bacterium]
MASGTERGGVGSRGTVAEALPAGANGAGSAGAGAPLMVSASGLRGIAGKSLTPDVAARFAGALGTHLRGRLGGGRPTVVVGRDGRAGGQVVHQAALAGLMGAGCDVIDLGVAMTPTVGVMVDELEADGGMVVTASHNPQEWNGLKCLVSDRTGEQGRVGAHAPAAEEAGEIIARYGRGGWAW